MFESNVVRAFRCKESKEHYAIGDTYRHEKAARVSHLMKEGFLQQKDLKEEPKEENTSLELEHIGGGYYKLPNGDKVQGKEAAQKALEEM